MLFHLPLFGIVRTRRRCRTRSPRCRSAATRRARDGSARSLSSNTDASNRALRAAQSVQSVSPPPLRATRRRSGDASFSMPLSPKPSLAATKHCHRHHYHRCCCHYSHRHQFPIFLIPHDLYFLETNHFVALFFHT